MHAVIGTLLGAGGAAVIENGYQQASRPHSTWDFFSGFCGNLTMALGTSMAIVAGAMLIVAVLKYFQIRTAIADQDGKLREVQERLEELDRERAPAPPERPAPQVLRPSVPSFVLARF